LVQREREGLAARYELLLIILLALLAEMSVAAVNNRLIGDLISQLELNHLENRADALRAFVNYNFAPVLSFVSDFAKFEILSLYFCYASAIIKRKVRINCVAHYVAPFAVVSFQSIAEALGIVEEQVLDTLSEAIEHQKVIGRIDLIDRTLERRSGLLDWKAKKKVLDEATVLSIRVQQQRLT
jgi:hypothetical protein